MADHNHTVAEPASRSAFVRSARTNNPWVPPPGLSGRDTRRWRDLVLEYRGRLGERAEREDVRARLRSLVWLSIELDRMQEGRIRGDKVPLHTVLHATQELRTLIAELGLNEPTQTNSEVVPNLRDYLNGGVR